MAEFVPVETGVVDPATILVRQMFAELVGSGRSPAQALADIRLALAGARAQMGDGHG